MNKMKTHPILLWSGQFCCVHLESVQFLKPQRLIIIGSEVNILAHTWNLSFKIFTFELVQFLTRRLIIRGSEFSILVHTWNLSFEIFVSSCLFDSTTGSYKLPYCYDRSPHARRSKLLALLDSRTRKENVTGVSFKFFSRLCRP